MCRNLIAVTIFILIFGCSSAHMKDYSNAPLIKNTNHLEAVANLHLPPGNIAVSHDHRLFFSFHPDGYSDVKVAELVDGKAVPFPDQDFQKKRSGLPFFDTVLSVRIDLKNRLWTLDHGDYGRRQPRLLAFDIRTGQVVHHHDFSPKIAGFGSFLNDFQILSSGDIIFIADTSAPIPLLGGKPAIVVYDVKKKTARRLFENHPSVRATDILVRVGKEVFNFMGIPLKIAVDSIALDPENQWLYYGALNSDKLYRIKTEYLLDDLYSSTDILPFIEVFSDKSMSNGITIDLDENIYLSDMENSAIHVINWDRKLRTLIRDPKMIRWPDGFSFGPDGWLYFTCSDLTNVLGKKESQIKANAPYHIFRFQPGTEGIPGH